MGWRRLFTYKPDRTWLDWAESKGFAYQQDGADLPGRYYEALPEPSTWRYSPREEYFGVVRGTWRDRSFVYFQRRVQGRGGTQVVDGFVLQLPGTPRADLLTMTPAEAFGAAGFGLPREGTFEWHSPDWILGTGFTKQPAQFEAILEYITVQLAAAPAELWQP